MSFSKRKKFDESLYKEHDTPACNRILHHLIEDMGLYAVRNEDKYGPDIVVYSGFKKSCYVEVEIKKVWRADQDVFPWSEVNLPERKGKFLKLGLPIEFYILRSDMQRAIVLPDYVVEPSPIVEVPNKYIESGEKFYKVDVLQCITKEV